MQPPGAMARNRRRQQGAAAGAEAPAHPPRYPQGSTSNSRSAASSCVVDVSRLSITILVLFSFPGRASTTRGVTEDSNWSYQAGELTFLDDFIFNHGQRYIYSPLACTFSHLRICPIYTLLAAVL